MGARLAVLVLALAGCSWPGSSADPDGAVGSGDAFQPPGSVTIRVRNDAARTLYVQSSGWSGQEVTTILEAGVTMGRDTCEICNCATCPSCAVCGRALAKVAEIPPGDALDFTWDQIDWSIVENGCRPTLSCEQPSLVGPGPLTARAEYSDSFTDSTLYPGESFIGPPLTAEVVFQHPTADVVVVPLL